LSATLSAANRPRAGGYIKHELPWRLALLGDWKSRWRHFLPHRMRIEVALREYRTDRAHVIWRQWRRQPWAAQAPWHQRIRPAVAKLLEMARRLNTRSSFISTFATHVSHD